MKLIDRKKLATIMTLASVLGSKSSAMNTSENVGVAVNSNSESPYNNQPKLGIKKSLNDISKKLSNIVTYRILAGIGAGAAGVGALAVLLFGNRSTKSACQELARSVEFAVSYLKEHGVTNVRLDTLGFVAFVGPDGCRILLDNVVKAAKFENPNAQRKELVDAARRIVKWPLAFYTFQYYFARSVAEIGLRYNLVLSGICDADIADVTTKLEGYKRDEIVLDIGCKDKKLLIEIIKVGGNNKRIDITQEYNKDNPETDLDKRKKGFYNDLVEFINNDDFIRKLFLE